MSKLNLFLIFILSNFVFSYVYGQECKCKKAVSTCENKEKILLNFLQKDTPLYKRILELKDLDKFYGISKDGENNIYVIGIFQEKWALVKYNPPGEILFKTVYDLDIFSSLNELIIDGGCYVYFAGKIGDEYVLLKFDFDGKVLWEKKLEKFVPDEDFKFPLDSPCFASLSFSE
ncbi:MAG: hypothetical protein WHV67_03680 [Thermoanaerobaculia bacterium]